MTEPVQFGSVADPVERSELPWSAIAMSLLIGGLVGMIAAGRVFHATSIGAALIHRGCHGLSAWGLLLLAAAAASMTAGARIFARDHAALPAMQIAIACSFAAAPLSVLVASLPGFLGCGPVAAIANMAFVGPALTGGAGFIVAGAAAALVGAALGSALRFDLPEQVLEERLRHARAQSEVTDLAEHDLVDDAGHLLLPLDPDEGV